MPYGLPKEIGGDSPENNEKMERCIARVMTQGKDKIRAIKICKAMLIKSRERK